jgi:hypothetical protein
MVAFGVLFTFVDADAVWEYIDTFGSSPTMLMPPKSERLVIAQDPSNSVSFEFNFRDPLRCIQGFLIFVRDRRGVPHVFRASASDHGLGGFESPGKREDRPDFIAKVWEDIISFGGAAADRYVGIPVTARFSLSSPSLLARVRKLGPIRPFRFLTARGLEPSSDPNAPRSELIAYIPTTDELSRSKLMDLPRQRSWASVLESFIRHRDRKYEFDDAGRIIRRHIRVRKDRIVGLGKEAKRIELSRVLGLWGGGGDAKRYVDWRSIILALPASWAKTHGISERSFRHLRRTLRSGRIPRGHGARTFTRVCEALAAEWTVRALT